MNLSMKQNHGHIEQTCSCQGGGSWGRDRMGGLGYQM